MQHHNLRLVCDHLAAMAEDVWWWYPCHIHQWCTNLKDLKSLPTHQCILEKASWSKFDEIWLSISLLMTPHCGIWSLKMVRYVPMDGRPSAHTIGRTSAPKPKPNHRPRWCLPVDSWPSGATRCNCLVQLSIFVSIPQLERAALCPFSAIP